MSGAEKCSFAARGCSCRPGWPEDWAELLTAIDDEGVVRNLATAPWPYTMDDAHRLRRAARRSGCCRISSSPCHERRGQADRQRRAGPRMATMSNWATGLPASIGGRAMPPKRRARCCGWPRRLAIAGSAGHFADNPASGRVLAKAGFRPTGELVAALQQGPQRRCAQSCLCGATGRGLRQRGRRLYARGLRLSLIIPALPARASASAISARSSSVPGMEAGQEIAQPGREDAAQHAGLARTGSQTACACAAPPVMPSCASRSSVSLMRWAMKFLVTTSIIMHFTRQRRQRLQSRVA